MSSEPDYRAVDVAIVHKAGVAAAELAREPTGITFSYLPDYRGPAVATTLPVAADPIRMAGGALPPFFSGLLPEGRRLTAIRQAIKTSADDELSLLLAVGSDTIGDVQVLPPANATPTDTVATTPTSLADANFRELFARAIGPSLEDRAAIAGAQDKVSGRMISLPLAYNGADWILKLDPPEVPHLVRNEAFFLEAARASGLPTAEAEVVHDREGQPGLLVRRFDRVTIRGAATTCRAQEDACQVLGRYPADKYRLTTDEVIQGLAAKTGAPIVAARTLLQQFAFAYLSCNGDAHGKNFSILHDGREWRASPAYDLPSTQPYRDDTMALSLGGKDREDIGRTDFVALGERSGVPAKAMARLLDDLIATAPTWIERLGELPFDERRVHKLEKACRYRVDRLAK